MFSARLIIISKNKKINVTVSKKSMNKKIKIIIITK